MKYIALMAGIIFLCGCAQLQRGQMQPVKRISVKEEIYFTTCSGSVEDWGSCNRKARETCKGDYATVEKQESPVGGRRELTFRCGSK